MRVAREPASEAPAGSRRAGSRAEIRDLISFRIHAVANQISRGAALAYRREFGVSLMEWRTLALLGAQSPLSQGELARHGGLDKGQMSRVVAGLVARDLVAREPDPADARGVRLALTRAGRRTYEGLIAAANRRNDALAAALAPHEHRQLDRMLERLAARARQLTQAEHARA
jgi:DNA-binding MarR family transcriptional regulator